MILATITGFLTGFSLILAIGAQNAFVLRNGLMRTHVFWLCLFCALSDAALITAGVAGFGSLIARFPSFPLIMTLGGAIFLIFYGALRFWAAYQGRYALVLEGHGSSLATSLATAAAFTWLNPHVYLDTLGLVGAISTQYGILAERIAFGSGAVCASFVFFFSLGYGARFLAPIMQSARAWVRLDIGVGILMWALAVKLLFGLEY